MTRSGSGGGARGTKSGSGILGKTRGRGTSSTTLSADFADYVQGSEQRHKRLAYLLTGDLDRAEDLLQTAYAKLYPRWNRVRDDSPDDSLRRIMVNQNASWWHRSQGREVSVDDLATLAGATSPSSNFGEVRGLLGALCGLPERQRGAVVLRHWCGLSEVEVARTMNRSLGVANADTSRGLQALLQALQPEAGGVSSELRDFDQLVAEKQLLVSTLDRVAGMADQDVVSDRLGGIRSRVQAMARRRTAVVAVAAVGLAAGGIGAAWSFVPGLGGDGGRVTAGEPTATASQMITSTAVPSGDMKVKVQFTISGDSGLVLASDGDSQEPKGEIAGALDWTVSLDGNVVLRSELDRECVGGQEFRSYAERYFADDPLRISVDKPGTHEVQVLASYCGADGEVLTTEENLSVDIAAPQPKPEPDSNNPDSPAQGNGELTELSIDVDGEGVSEKVTYFLPNDAKRDQVLEVLWSDGEVSTFEIPNDLTRDLYRVHPDLDGDGGAELIVHGGGGEADLLQVFRVVDREIQPVEAVLPDGSRSDELWSAYPVTSDYWTWMVNEDGFFSYRSVAAELIEVPADLELFKWKLTGNTLTRVPGMIEGCFREAGASYDVVLKPC